MNEYVYDYIIYHKDCTDGFTGLLVFLKTKYWKKGKTKIYPDVPFATEPPPLIENKNVIIIDVAYNKTMIQKIAEKVNRLLFIDHHKSIQEDVENLELDNRHKIIFDTTYSGASLTWKYFFNSPPPLFVKYVADNDMGIWTDPKVAALAAYIETDLKKEPTEININIWNNMFENTTLDEYITIGNHYHKYKMSIIKSFAKNTTIELFPSKQIFDMTKAFEKVGQYKVAVHNGTCPNASLLGNYIASNFACDFCMMWTCNVSKKTIVIAMRSISTDLTTIAKAMGGGGHPMAATFKFESANITDLFV